MRMSIDYSYNTTAIKRAERFPPVNATPHHTPLQKQIPSSHLSLAGAGLARTRIHDPAGQTVGNVVDIASGGAVAGVQVALSDSARVVTTRGRVDISILVDELHKPVTRAGTLSTVADHLDDALLSVGSVERDPVMRLHDTGVRDAVVGGADVDTAVRLLHDDGEDESRVDKGVLGDLEDAVVHVLDLLLGWVRTATKVGARLLDQGHIVVPEGFESAPLVR